MEKNNPQRRGKILILFVLLISWVTYSSGLGQGFDPDEIINQPDLKKELQKIDSDKKAENLFIRIAKRTLDLKQEVDFCEELWDGAFTDQIEAIMDVPVEKWRMAGWGYKEIENVRKIVLKNRKNPFIHQLKDKGKHLATALSLYSMATDIYAGISGDDRAKLNAVIKAYEFAQDYIMNKLGIGISSIASMGANVIKFSLDLYIKEAQAQYEDYWWNAYMQYLEGKYKLSSWKELAKTQGKDGIKRRLYEFWDAPYENAAMFYGKARIQTAPALAERTLRDKYAAYYYSKFIYPTLKLMFEKEAAWEAYQKERLAKQKYAELMKLKGEIDLLRRAIMAAEGLKEKEEGEIESLLINPAQKTIEVGGSVTFTALAEYKDGSTKDVSGKAVFSPSREFTATESGEFTVTATYKGVTGMAKVIVNPKCPENSHWDSELKKCVCDEGYEENEELGKCISIDGALDDMEEDEGEEEDICSEDELAQLYNRLLSLIARAEELTARIDAYYTKFFKEIGDQNSDPCRNNLAAYCLVGAEKNAAELEALVGEVKELSTELIMRFAICPETGLELNIRSLISDLSGLGRLRGSAKGKITDMHTTLVSHNCDPAEMRERGEQFAERDADPNAIQDGGFGTEIEGDGIDNDGDGLQDEEVLSGYNITMVLYDSGNLKDDIFELSVSGLGNLGTTPAGGLRTYGANLSPGTYMATVTVILAPDDCGTYTLIVREGSKTLASASSGMSCPPQGSAISVPFTVTGR